MSDDPNLGLDLTVDPETGLTKFGLTPEEVQANIAARARLRAKKAREADYSGGWWSDIGAWYKQNTYTPEGAGIFGTRFIGTKPSKADYQGLSKIGTDFDAPKMFTEEEVVAREDKKVQEFVDTQISAGNEGIYQWRPVKGFAPIVGNQPPDISTVEYLEPGLVRTLPNGVKELDPNKFQQARGRGPAYYKGSGLTDEFGRLARRKYDVEDPAGVDARNELMFLNRAQGQTLALLKELKRTGFYGGSEISNIALNNQGFGPEDEVAMARFLSFSNQKFQTWQAVAPQLAQMSTIGSAGGPRFKPDSEAEMIAYANEISLALTGEKLSKAKLKQALESTVATQRSAFASGTDIPRSATILEQQIPKSNPAQAASYGLGNAMKLAFEALGA